MPTSYANRMELRHLRYFVAVAEEESVTRAAARLHLSQPTLSRQIADLEDELAVALFDHGAKKIRLTSAGRFFLEEARAVLQRSGLAVEAMRAMTAGSRGEINVGHAPSPTAELLPQTLRLFQAAHPDVRVKLHDLSETEIVRALKDGTLEVALTVRSIPELMTGLAFEELRRYALCVALPLEHRLVGMTSVSVEQLIGERLIVYNRADYEEYQNIIERLFAPFQVRPKRAEEHDSGTGLLASVEAGRGIALVTENVAAIAGPRVKIRKLVPEPPPIVVGVAYVEKALTAITKSFVAAARRASSKR
jgi:LysR family transcriptional regulator, benzoate and cis,cis-muconate-responsive activator of ben and cat genes